MSTAPIAAAPTTVVEPDFAALMPEVSGRLPEALVADRKRYMGEGWWSLWHELGWPACDKGGEPSTRLDWPKLAQLTRLAEHVSRAGVPGDYAEFGVWRGGAMCFAGTAFDRLGEGSRRLLGFDAFVGLPDLGARDGDRLWKGQFSDTSADAVRALMARHGLADRLELFEGWFEETIGAVAGRTLALVHVDCDLHDAAMLVLERVWPRVSPGGVVVFDDYRCEATPGVTIAVETFFADRPESVRMTPGLATSAWVVKRS